MILSKRDMIKLKTLMTRRPIGALVLAFCRYHQIRPEGFDIRIGTCSFYRLTGQEARRNNESLERRVLETLGLLHSQYMEFFMACLIFERDGVFHLPASMIHIDWFMYVFGKVFN